MINRLKTLFAPALLMAGLAACGGGSASYTDAAHDQINDFCSKAFECMAEFGDDAQFTSFFGSSEQDCVDTFGALVDEQAPDVEASIADGRIEFNSADADECASAANSLACDMYWTAEGDPSCDTVIVGLVADGDACTIDADCAEEGSFCDETDLVCGPGGV
jgi:hypothetical protein